VTGNRLENHLIHCLRRDLDIKILLLTVPAVLSARGAY